MSIGDDRDRAVDRLLKTSLADGLAAPSTDCLGAEQIAAWSAAALSAADTTMVEAHLASCARCQALAAAFARTLRDAAEPVRATWGFRWWMPMAAAAAAGLLLWVFVPRGADAPGATPAMTIAQRDEVPAPVSGTAPGVVEPPDAFASRGNTMAEPVAPASSHVPSAEARPAAGLDTRTRETTLGTRDAKQLANTLSSERPATLAKAEAENRAAAVAAPPPSAAPADTATSTRTGGGSRMLGMPAEPISGGPGAAASSSAIRAPAAAPVVSAQSGERSFAVTSAQAALPISGVVVLDFTSIAAADASERAGRAASAGMLDAVTALQVPRVRWRILSDGRVERSTTDGSVWEGVALEESVRVRVGAAPSPAICWLGGASGVVLRSSDGRTFSRVSSPDRVDITAIQASDALQASVTMTDGRRFTTTDGGASWRQESR